MQQSTALVPAVPAPPAQLVREEDFLPLLSIESALKRKEALNTIIREVLIPNIDYGEQPGSASKQRVLKKSGAEKLISTFGLSFHIAELQKIEDWTGANHNGEPFFWYDYRIALYKGDRFLGEATGSCNSWEKKYRYQWISESEAEGQMAMVVGSVRPEFAKLPRRGGKKILFEPDFALDKRETSGRYGKPIEYWDRFDAARRAGTALRTQKQLGKRTYDGWQIEVDDTLVRVPNPNAPDVVNTVEKMAFKRALVAACVVVTNCSDAFTQDLEDDEEGEHAYTPAPAPGPAPEPEQMPLPTEPPAPIPGQAVSVRPIPEEMRVIIANVRSDPSGKNLKPNYDVMWRHFSKRGEAAARAHEEANQKFRNRVPKGQGTIEDHVGHFLDLYDLLQTFPEPVTQ